MITLPRRIAVVGDSGAGKTTAAREIATIIGAPHVELDASFHEPEWTPAETAVFRARVDAATSGDAWVADGNYGVVRDLTWGRADTLVWLDYPLPLTMWRLFWRSLRRGMRKEVLWNGNTERLSSQFLSRESLFLWNLQRHSERRKEWPAIFAEPEFAHLWVVRLTSPSELERYIASLRSQYALQRAAPASSAAD